MKHASLKLALLAGLGIAAVSGASYAPRAAAQVAVGVTIGTAPPPPRFERMPPPRPGYIWAPGYWRWNGYHHVWAGGYWMPARPGWSYHRAYWNQGPGGRWRFHQGYWMR